MDVENSEQQQQQAKPMGLAQPHPKKRSRNSGLVTETEQRTYIRRDRVLPSTSNGSAMRNQNFTAPRPGGNKMSKGVNPKSENKIKGPTIHCGAFGHKNSRTSEFCSTCGISLWKGVPFCRSCLQNIYGYFGAHCPRCAVELKDSRAATKTALASASITNNNNNNSGVMGPPFKKP